MPAMTVHIRDAKQPAAPLREKAYTPLASPPFSSSPSTEDATPTDETGPTGGTPTTAPPIDDDETSPLA